ncbi:MAG: prepilin-type N-terminal cleavage/methylation domain-containing protein [Phycisphaeraceae bacterium]|nr:prepilin-type N-terminal cleavage/methylation domain-containing protein [Phycisphaeraceae bacterium]MCW5762805.1 prepilin-type N-terminal cleavage/methylation domain-containing protein [Phycisphaeraceae bacterium]
MNSSIQQHASGIVGHVRRAFTLVEILIVVVILGVLAAVVVPQFGSAVQDASIGTTTSELHKIRRALEVYMVQNANLLPTVAEGDGTWGPLVTGSGYLKGPPLNPYVGGSNAGVIVFRNAPDNAYQTTYGWVYDNATGRIWAGGFDGNDNPLPR